MKNNINIKLLKLIEVLIFLSMFFIIFYDAILYQPVADKIYSFGIFKFTFFIFIILLSLYFSIGIREKQYLVAKFNSKHLSRSLMVVALCALLYLVNNLML